MGMNYVLIVLGLIICFGGIYLRRACSAVMGLAWGSLSSLIVMLLVVGLGGADSSEVLLVMIFFGLLCSVLSAIYYKVCSAINAFLSSFWIVILSMFLMGHSQETSVIFIVAAIISSLLAYIAYIFCDVSYMLMTAFTGAYIANLGFFGVNHHMSIGDTAYEMVWSYSDMASEILIGTIFLGIVGVAVQYYRFHKIKENKKISDSNHIQDEGDKKEKSSADSYIKATKFKKTGIEKDALWLVVPVLAYLVMPFCNNQYGMSMNWDYEVYRVLYWVTGIAEMVALAVLVYFALVKTARAGIIYSLVQSVCYCIINFSSLGYYSFWPLLVSVFKMLIIWSAMFILSKATSHEGVKPLVLLVIGLFMYFYAIDWIAYFYYGFYFNSDRIIQCLFSLFVLFLLFKTRVNVNVFSPASAYEMIKTNAAEMMLPEKRLVTGEASSESKSITQSAEREERTFSSISMNTSHANETEVIIKENSDDEVNNVASLEKEYEGLFAYIRSHRQEQYKLDWLVESLTLGHVPESNGYYIMKSIEEGLPYYCETEYEYSYFHKADSPVLKGSIKGMMDIAFFYHPVAAEHNPHKRKYWQDLLVGMAEQGNYEAQAALMLNNVLDPEEAEKYKMRYADGIKQKALAGDPNAQLAYGEFLCPYRSEDALEWLEKAGKQGLSDAWFNLAERYIAFILLDDDGPRRNPLPQEEKDRLEKGKLNAYLEGAKADNGILAPRCQYKIAMYYEDGNEYLHQDLEQAKYWYKKAADHGDEAAERSYKSILEHPEWYIKG